MNVLFINSSTGMLNLLKHSNCKFRSNSLPNVRRYFWCFSQMQCIYRTIISTGKWMVWTSSNWSISKYLRNNSPANWFLMKILSKFLKLNSKNYLGSLLWIWTFLKKTLKHSSNCSKGFSMSISIIWYTDPLWDSLS